MTRARAHKIRLILFILIILSIVSALILYALRQNISLFYSPTQVHMGEAPLEHAIRVGGMVEKGSIVRAQGGLEVSFNITDFEHSIRVSYTGILPDLFREGQGIVAQGQLIDLKHFKANEVLAKHDANYMPPEVKASLKIKGRG